MSVGGYTLRYEGLDTKRTSEKEINQFTLEVLRGGRSLGTIRPERNFHFAQRQTQSEVAIRTTPIEDLYVVVSGIDGDGTAVLRAFVNPLTWWIWAGAAVMAAGMTVILAGRAPAPVPAPARTRLREPAVVAR
jgi:cytochrome c-type biogenesis protein CcmF